MSFLLPHPGDHFFFLGGGGWWTRLNAWLLYDIVNETLYLYCEINDPLVYTNLAPETRF